MSNNGSAAGIGTGATAELKTIDSVVLPNTVANAPGSPPMNENATSGFSS